MMVRFSVWNVWVLIMVLVMFRWVKECCVCFCSLLVVFLLNVSMMICLGVMKLWLIV